MAFNSAAYDPLEETKSLQNEVPIREEHQTPSALDNEDFLEHLMAYLPFDDLKNCRLVNFLWNRRSTHEISSRCEKILFQNSEVENYRWGIEDMPKLTQLVNTSWHFPCTEFYIEEGITIGHPSREITMRIFFENVGPLITNLTVEESVDPNFQHFAHTVPQNVEYLQLRTLNVIMSENEKLVANKPLNSMEFIQSILEHAANLEKLYLEIPSAPSVVTTVLKILSGEHSSSVKLKSLSVIAKLNDNHFEILPVLELKLQNLQLEFTDEKQAISTISIRNFLTTQANTLQDLELTSVKGFGGNFAFMFPNLPKLEALKISILSFNKNAVGEFSDLGLHEISYVNQFSVLNCVELKKDTVEILDEFFHSKMLPMETVVELVLPYKLTDPVTILHALRIFPKLRKLEIPARKEIVNAVYELCGESLEELTLEVVYDGHTVNELLTGCSLWRYRQLGMMDSEDLEAMELQHVPLLQRLKVLRLHSENCGQSISLSDTCCQLVLLRMRNLKCLDLHNGRGYEITEPMLRSMQQKFKVLL